AGARRLLKRSGAVVLMLLVAGGLWLGAGAPLAPTDLAKRVRSLRDNITGETGRVGVRKNYWIAAWRMIRERPLTGFGLDQYGIYYTRYKPLAGWAVQRAHNAYLQLAADGGVFLLGLWIAVWAVFFRARFCENALPDEPLAGKETLEARERILGRCGAGVLVAMLVITYLAFNGLGIEFFFRELWSPGSARAHGNPLPLRIHFTTHVLILPIAAAAVFFRVFRLLNDRSSDRLAWTLVRVGLFGVLVHLLADFYSYMQMPSASLWTALGLALLYTDAAREPRIRFRLPAGEPAAMGLLFFLLFVFGTAGWKGPLADWQRTLNLAAAERCFQSGETEKALVLYRAIAERGPPDAKLARRLSEMYLNLARREARARVPPGLSPEEAASFLRKALPQVSRAVREEALRWARESSRLVPQHAASHAYLGGLLLELFPSDPERVIEARAAYERAHKLYPHKPEYLVRLGEIERLSGRPKEAASYWRAALALDSDPRLGDALARLSQKRHAALEEAVRKIEEAQKISPSGAPGASPSSGAEAPSIVEEWLTAVAGNEPKAALRLASQIAPPSAEDAPDPRYEKILERRGIPAAFLRRPFNAWDLRRWQEAFRMQAIAQEIVAGRDEPLRALYEAVLNRVKPGPLEDDPTPWPLAVWEAGIGLCDRQAWVFCELAYQAGWETRILCLMRPGSEVAIHTFCEVRKGGEVAVADVFSRVFLPGRSAAELAASEAFLREVWPDREDFRAALRERVVVSAPAFPQDFCRRNERLHERLAAVLGARAPRFGVPPEAREKAYRALIPATEKAPASFTEMVWLYPVILLRRDMDRARRAAVKNFETPSSP
ncbi:MAG: O-antigen ligase family protein, partial [Planctomycetota bacterium]